MEGSPYFVDWTRHVLLIKRRSKRRALTFAAALVRRGARVQEAWGNVAGVVAGIIWEVSHVIIVFVKDTCEIIAPRVARMLKQLKINDRPHYLDA